MPLLEVIQTQQISASIRLTDTTATQVDQYAAFIRACADDVVEQALSYVFSKDRDFQEFLKTPEARQVASTLRIRKAPAPEAAESAGKEACFRGAIPVQSRGCCGRIEGMILHSNPWQSHNGASHRKNLDTPPLSRVLPRNFCSLTGNLLDRRRLHKRGSLLETAGIDSPRGNDADTPR